MLLCHFELDFARSYFMQTRTLTTDFETRQRLSFVLVRNLGFDIKALNYIMTALWVLKRGL